MTNQIIRQQIHLIPELVKAALLTQAIDLEKVIACTFQPSEDFKVAALGLPMNYLGEINELYTDLLYKSFEAGVRHAKSKYESSPFNAMDSLIVAPIPQVFADDLLVRFKSRTESGLKSFQHADRVYKQLLVDIAQAFDDGVKEGVLACEQAKFAESQPDPMPQEDDAKQVTAASSTEALDAYCKLLGTPESEKILRYYLGLGPAAVSPAIPTEPAMPIPQVASDDEAVKETEIAAETISVTAAKKKDEDEEGDELKVGPFFIKPLKELIQELCKELQDSKEASDDDDVPYETLTDGDLEYVIVDSIVPDLDRLTDDQLLRALCIALDLADCPSLDEAFEKGDGIAEEVTRKLDLDGDALLMALDGSYDLVFSFKPKNLGKICPKEDKEKAEAAVSKDDKSLAKSPMGALSVKVQDELRLLSKLTSNFLFKDLKKASSRVAEYYGSILTDIRSSKSAMRDGTRQLNAGLASAIEQVYGLDALDFYNSLRG